MHISTEEAQTTHTQPALCNCSLGASASNQGAQPNLCCCSGEAESLCLVGHSSKVTLILCSAAVSCSLGTTVASLARSSAASSAPARTDSLSSAI